MNIPLYPPTPLNANPSVLEPSAAFKKQAVTVIASIFLFFVVYILLVLAALALSVACFYYGALLIITLPKFFTLMIGLGLMALGVSVVAFLIKFIFAVSKNENQSRVQIYEAEQPELFAFINKLSSEIKTPRPKKIFISPDVNAAVFYNSSFWSMLLPVRKNLEIGLGLVNSINISEFKGVIAHEFGHFSQRSMKLGSFTYNVNQVIYNMLYNNTSYTKFLNSWGSVNGYLAFFAGITVKIAQAIQWILKRMYELINKSYFGLSREMEFHADAVAATVAGGNNLVSALSRIEFAASCYNSALNNAGDWLKEKKQTANIFENQLTIYKSIARDHHLPLDNGLPKITYQFIQSFSQSRINYKNQWASHPTLEERKQHLDTIGVDVEPNHTSAWALFTGSKELQETITENLYRNVPEADSLVKIDAAHFEEVFNAERESAKLPDLFKGFYDKRFINVEQWDFNSLVNEPAVKSFDELFNEENGQLQASITSNENDKAIVTAIIDKQIDVKSFDFDGSKYDAADSELVLKQLETEIAGQIEKQQLLDRDAFLFFYHYAASSKASLVENYMHYQVLYNRYREFEERANKVIETIRPFYAGENRIETIKAIIAQLKAVEEKKLKGFYKMLLQENILIEGGDTKLAEKLAAFTDKDYEYFVFDSFIDHELGELSNLAVEVAETLNKQRLAAYRALLKSQEAVYSL
jgi:Zn-dependent protease with chaperone function